MVGEQLTPVSSVGIGIGMLGLVSLGIVSQSDCVSWLRFPVKRECVTSQQRGRCTRTGMNVNCQSARETERQSGAGRML